MQFKNLSLPRSLIILCVIALVSCANPSYFQNNIEMRPSQIHNTKGRTINKNKLIRQLQKQNIQVIQYGNTTTLIVPTDQYFEFDTPRLSDLCYAGLNNIIKLMKQTACGTICGKIYVAGFTDNIGSRLHKKDLSQAQAETMLTFLWAHDIPATQLHAEGYGDQHTIGDNHFIRGSAYNRRIEIQWTGPN